MRKLLLASGVVLTVMLTMSSCLKSDDEVTTYDDVAVTSATLGTLNRYLTTTTSAGEDSIYKVTFTGSTIKLVIDQVGCRIYNSDPLPYGTDLKHVVCTLSTKNSALVTIKSTTSDSLFVVSSTDSIDFSTPRTLRIMATDGEHYREYEMALTARAQQEGVLRWTEMTGEVPYVCYDIVSYPEIGQVVGYTDDEVYGFGWDDKLKKSSDMGVTWTEELLDAPDSLLPRECLSFVWWPMANNLKYALMAGKRTAGDTTMTLWRKVIDADRQGKWAYMVPTEDNNYLLPAMEQVELTRFKGYLLALGSNGLIYRSQDQGITWKTSTKLQMPTEFGGAPFMLITSYENLMLWDAAGRVWQGEMD